MWYCKRSHRVARGKFTITRHHDLEDICRRTQVKEGGQDFTKHPVNRNVINMISIAS